MTVSEHIDALRKLMKERTISILFRLMIFIKVKMSGHIFRPEHLLQALTVPPEPRLLL